MKQYGDITRISGEILEPVDLIVGGSPCQDLSVAGKQAGLKGERSWLFMEMIRLIKQMRKATNGNNPRYALWENVPGVFSSSGGGQTFQPSSQNLYGSSSPQLPMCLFLRRGGRNQVCCWVPTGRLAGELMMRNFGECPSVVVESHLSWILEEKPRQKYYLSQKACLGILNRAKKRGKQLPERLKIILEIQSGLSKNTGGGTLRVSIEKSYTLRAGHEATICIQGNCIDRADTAGCNGKGWIEDVSYTLNTIDRPAVYDPSVHHGYKEFEDVSETVKARYGTGGNNQPLVLDIGFFAAREDRASKVLARMYKDPPVTDIPCVRRITPLECERLQGFPDGWTDIPGATDSKRYKALGNSIALPFWEHLAKRFVQIGNVKTIGSLFDGIGGFPLCFQRAGAETLWISEIDLFCQQVTAAHFSEE